MRTRVYEAAAIVALPVAVLGAAELVLRTAMGYFDGIGEAATLTGCAAATLLAALMRRRALLASTTELMGR